MKRLLPILIAALLLAGPTSAALAKSANGGGYVSPGQSAAAQYTEDVPTAGGNTPVQSVHDHGASVIPGSTLNQLDGSATGAAAARLAQSLAPKVATRNHHRTAHRTDQTGAVHGDPAAAIQAPKTPSGGGDGLTVPLVILLVAILVLGSGAGLIRIKRRR